MAPLRHRFVCLLTGFSLTAGVWAQELPTKSDGPPEDLEAEAKKLVDELPMLDTEAARDDHSILPAPDENPDGTVERMKGILDRARKKQQRWEKLAKQGVLSRAEAESCLVEVADAQANHERARVANMRQEFSRIQQRVAKGEVDKTMLEAAEAALQSSVELAETTERQAHLTRLAIARNNLDRHRKLHASGLVSRVQLQRAESRVQKIEANGQDQQALK
jgi:multidrug resistance efflux pump